MFDDVARKILPQIGVELGHPHYEDYRRALTEILQKRCGNPIAPSRSESLAISIQRPKTAALAFDRVYRVPVLIDPIPEEVGFYCAIPMEVGLYGYGLALLVAVEVGLIPTDSEKNIFRETTNETPQASTEEKMLRLLAREISNQIETFPTIFYHAKRTLQESFPTGSRSLITAAIKDLAVVDEGQLSP